MGITSGWLYVQLKFRILLVTVSISVQLFPLHSALGLRRPWGIIPDHNVLETQEDPTMCEVLRNEPDNQVLVMGERWRGLSHPWTQLWVKMGGEAPNPAKRLMRSIGW